MSNNQKSEISGFYKVSEGIIINKDNSLLSKYKAEKNNLKKINVIENDVAELKTDIKEIKELLRSLLK